MKKIDSFNEIQVREIREIFPLVCEEIPNYKGKELCPKCKIHHTRMPNKETFKKLLNYFDATDKAWAEVFHVDRATVSKQKGKYSIGSYNLNEIWTDRRYWDEWATGIDEQPFKDFFELLIKFPRSKEIDLMKVAEINKHYFSMVMKDNPSLKNDYQNALFERSYGNEYLFCIKCKIRKKEDNFQLIEKNKSKRSVICDLCNKENIDKCTRCGKIYVEKKLQKLTNGGLVCFNCIN